MDDDDNGSERRQNENRGQRRRRRNQVGRAEVHVDIGHYQDDIDSWGIRRCSSAPLVRGPRASLLRGPASDLLVRKLVRGSVTVVVNEGGYLCSCAAQT